MTSTEDDLIRDQQSSCYIILPTNMFHFLAHINPALFITS